MTTCGHINRAKPSEPYVPGNLGQKQCKLGVNVRLYVHLPLPILAKIKLPTQRVKLYNHACVCSCVGPIVDVKEQSDLFYRERYMANILLRTIAFSTTQCISTWRCLTLFSLQAVIVPVGRIALGRILNVVGSIIDPHSQVCHSCQFNNTNQATIGDSQESQLYTNEAFLFLSNPHSNVNNWNRHFLTSTAPRGLHAIKSALNPRYVLGLGH